MKRLSVASLFAAVAFLGFAVESDAHGLFRRSRGCDSCCESAPSATVAPAPVQYEERKVTTYKRVMTERDVDVLVCKRVVTEEKFTYTVCVPVTKQEMRKQIVCTPVMKEVEYTCTVMVPKMVQKKVQCTTYQCVRENIIEKVPVCRTVCVTVVDECGRCCVRRERVTVIEERTRCVVKRIPIVTEQLVNVCVYEPKQEKVKRMVCEIVRSERDVMVNVCTIEHRTQEGTRQVCRFVTTKEKQKVQVCELVPEVVTVRVPVCATTTCCSPSRDCGGHRGGLFRRGGCCN